MRVRGPSRRSVLTGTAALALGSLLPRLASAQGAPQGTPQAPASAPLTRLKVTAVERIELGGQKPLALFQNSLPGPVLRVKRGDKLAVSVENTIDTPLSLNWQGVRLPNPLDGVPGLTGSAIAKGASVDIAFTPPDAGTFLYRAFQPELAHRALAGALIVEEPGAPADGADHVLLIQSFAPDPTMTVPLLTVNGAVSPTLEAPAGGRARLRLVNASPQFLRLQVTATAYVIAVDGQPVQPFQLKDGRAQLTPGGRLDLAVDVGTADPIPVNVETSQLPIQLALVTPVGPGTTGAAALPPPTALPSNGLPDKIPLEKAARFEVPISASPVPLSGFASVGSVARGTSLVLALDNKSDAPVAVQLHGVPGRLLDGADDGWKPWWHDAVPVAPRSTARIALLPDSPGKWAIIGLRGGDGAVVAARSYDVT
ncbi:MAG: multicopper oxidase family protein [Pseudomonadota bacterium]